MDLHRSCNLESRNQDGGMKGTKGEVRTPRPETGELLQVGLGTINRKGRDDALHFTLVSEWTEDHWNPNKTRKHGNERAGIERITVLSCEALVRVPEVLSVGATLRRQVSPRSGPGC